VLEDGSLLCVRREGDGPDSVPVALTAVDSQAGRWRGRREHSPHRGGRRHLAKGTRAAAAVGVRVAAVVAVGRGCALSGTCWQSHGTQSRWARGRGGRECGLRAGSRGRGRWARRGGRA